MSVRTYYRDYIYNVLGQKVENRGLEVFLTADEESLLKGNSFIELYYPIYSNVILTKNNKSYRLNCLDSIKEGAYVSKYNGIAESISGQSTFLYEGNTINLNITEKIHDNSADIFVSCDYLEDNFITEVYKYYVLIKDYKNLEFFKEFFMENGYFVDLYDSSMYYEIEEVYKLINIYNCVLLVICLISLVFLYNIIKNLCLEERKNLLLLKLLGYKRKEINIILFSRLIIISVFSTFLYVLIFLLVNLIFNVLDYKLNIYIGLLFLLLVIIITLINITTVNVKIKNANVFQELSEEIYIK